jgi:hypothetical protein
MGRDPVVLALVVRRWVWGAACRMRFEVGLLANQVAGAFLTL